MQLVTVTALGVGGATMVGALLGFVMKKIPHKFNGMSHDALIPVRTSWAVVISKLFPVLDEAQQIAHFVTCVSRLTSNDIPPMPGTEILIEEENEPDVSSHFPIANAPSRSYLFGALFKRKQYKFMEANSSNKSRALHAAVRGL